LRVLKVNKLDDNQYPLQGGSTFGKDDPGLSEALGNQEPTLEDQGAKPVEVSDQEGDYRDEFQLSTANAVHDDSWLAFMRHIKDREGWHEYAGCHVNVKRDSEAYVSPIDKFSVEDFPYRTTCHWKDDAWFILDPFFFGRNMKAGMKLLQLVRRCSPSSHRTLATSAWEPLRRSSWMRTSPVTPL
jgi:hypothetical protein